MSPNTRLQTPSPIQAPGPIGLQAWLRRPKTLRDQSITYLTMLWQTYGDIVRFRLGVDWIYMVVNPRHVRHILFEQNANYGRDTRGFRALRPLFGNGLFTSVGNLWRHQRRIIQPTFHHDQIKGFTATMIDAAEQLIDRWAEPAGTGQVIDMNFEMSTVALQIVAETLFGSDIKNRIADISRATAASTIYVGERALAPFEWTRIFPSAKKTIFEKARLLLERTIDEIADQQRLSTLQRGNLMSLLIDARDAETGQPMSRQQLRDEMLTFLIAGNETTAKLLTWAFYLLSQHPEVVARLRQEIAATVNGGRLTADDLPKLHLTRAVLEETLRLRPPVWRLARSVDVADELDGFQIQKGSTVLLCAYLTHRHPDYWPDPERFSPDRFLSRDKAKRYDFFPFGAGPRICIGNHFALTEALVVLATVIQRYCPKLATKEPIELLPKAVLEPKGGMPMRIEKH